MKKKKILDYFEVSTVQMYLFMVIIVVKQGWISRKVFKTWHKFSTEIRFMLIPIIVLFIAHKFITGKF